jgi:cysteine desulfurase/selenocysteine lyase
VTNVLEVLKSGRPDVTSVRALFPVFAARLGLVYLDSAASTQRPQCVIDRVARFYAEENANIHRGVYALSGEATARYDEARALVARFLGAASPAEVVFTRGTTESLNLVAQAWGQVNVREGDEILVTEMEHHSNWVPWQMLAGRTGAVLRAVQITDEGELDLRALERMLAGRVRILAVTHASNVLGTVNPIRRICQMAHDAGVLVAVDAAQSVAHGLVDVQDLGCDFLAFSSHKIFGPFGVGVLWARSALLDAMPPWQGGGGMIGTVSLEETTWAPAPTRFEAGTPAIADALGLAEAIAFAESLGFDAIREHEASLLHEARQLLGQVPGVRLFGEARERVAVLAFTLAGVHPHDLGTVLDEDGIAIRAGHHCAQPLMRRLGVQATARASFSVYNTSDDVLALARSVRRAARLFGV